MNEIDSIIEENKKRNLILFEPYDPITGVGSSIQRVELNYINNKKPISLLVTPSFFNLKVVSDLHKIGSVERLIKKNFGYCNDTLIENFLHGLINERFKHDLEFYIYSCLKIFDEMTGDVLPFKLRKPQRVLYKVFEDSRTNNLPIRVNLLKSRQFGGTTFIEAYFFAIQTLIEKSGWHSAVISDVEDQARHIRGMFETFSEYYPEEICKINLKPYRGSSRNKFYKEGNCIIGVGSFMKPNNLRSYTFKMLHESELASWIDTKQRKGKDIDLALSNTVQYVPNSIIVKESTAKGIGNHWYNTWYNAENNTSGYKNVFIPFFEIEKYHKPIDNMVDFIKTMTENDKYLWNLGATLESINWYNWKKAFENYSDWTMCEEFPATAEEAFQSSGQRAFAPIYVNQNRINVTEPEYVGDIFPNGIAGAASLENIEFQKVPNGPLKIWTMPDTSIKMTNRYVVIVDIGGRHNLACWSVIKVIDRYFMYDGGKPETCATWRGHIDQDILAWKATQISKFYCNALLVVECNSLDKDETSEPDHFLTILDTIVKHYPNIYSRTNPEKIRQGLPDKYGYHTNKKTKPEIVDYYNGVLRDMSYVERDKIALDEADTYEAFNKKFRPKDGCFSDVLITSMIGCFISIKELPRPFVIYQERGVRKERKIISSEAMI